MTREDLVKGMALLSVAFPRDVDESVLGVYQAVLGRLTSQEWEQAVRRSLETERFFPAPATLLKYAQPEGVQQARAVEVYEQIIAAYFDGRKLDQRQIAEAYGVAAREAFLAAGGRHAFEWCEESSEPFRRKAFVEAWYEVAEACPRQALPPAEARKLLLAESDALL